MRTRALLLFIATLPTLPTCGPKTLANTPPPAAKSNEPWVAEHAEIATAACECETSQCLTEAKAKLDAIEAEHGGLDESPADIHKSRGEFEKCYRTGTVDPVRDLDVVTNNMCRCATADCVDKALIARLDYEEKYAGAELSTDQDSQVSALSAKYEECKATKITTGEVIASHIEKVTVAVCDCASGSGCGLPLTSLEDYPKGAKIVGYTDEVKDRVKVAMERLCNCANNGGVVGTYGGISTQIRCPKEEK